MLLSLVFVVGYPLFLLVFFRANAGMLFLAACAGLVLLSTLDPTVVSTAGAIVPGEGEAYIRLAVVFFAMTFTAMMYRNSVASKQLPLHILEILLTANMLLILLPAVTGISWLLNLLKNNIWQQVDSFKTLIVAAGFSLGLLLVLIHGQHHKSKRSKH